MKKILLFLLFIATPLRAQVNVDQSPLLLGKLAAANFNVTTDQPITITTTAPKYIITSILVTNASTSLTLAVGGFYTAASKGGVNLVAATQVFTALTAAGKYLNVTLASVVTTDVRSENPIYLSLTTAQGSVATADVYVFGYPLP